MPLTCDCNISDDFAYYEEGSEAELITLDIGAHTVNCASEVCKKTIRSGDECVSIPMYTVGDEGEMGEGRGDRWLCSDCGHRYLALYELGFCVLTHEDMKELVWEYNQRLLHHNPEK